MTDKILKITAIVALVVVIVVGLTTAFKGSPKIEATFGAAGNLLAENYMPYVMYNGGYNTAKSIKTTGDLTIGTSGTALVNMVVGTCNLIGTDASQAASSTVAYDCAVTGLTSSDVFIAMLASTTARGGSSSWEISSSKASTTAGFGTVLLSNNGPAAVPSATSVGSSTQYFAGH